MTSFSREIRTVKDIRNQELEKITAVKNQKLENPPVANAN